MYSNSGTRFVSSRGVRVWMSAIGVVLSAAAAGVLPLAAQRSTPPRPATKPPSPAGAPAQMKGIWEPVNYKQDLELQSVYFVTPEIGYVAGAAGTIIKTTDGGATWTAQLGGDPQNDARRITDLKFVDQSHGFAVQNTGVGDYVLLHTTDGENWEASGTIAQHYGDYAFVSPTVGVQSTSRHQIMHTENAGKTWKPAMNCALTVDVGGLSRNAECDIAAFHFPTPNVGYAIGSFLGGIKGVVVAKTENSGQSWNLWTVLPEQYGREGHIFFTDEQNGVACLGGSLFGTSDGAKTWHGIAGTDCPGKPAVRFADPEVGWTIANNKWNYTSDGGRHWSSRSVTFPAGVNAFSIPRRDRGYVVSDHGMVYRYRIVPASSSAPNSIAAPIVGTVNSPLDAQVDQLVNETQSLAAAGGATSGGGSGNAGGGSTPGAPSSGASSGGTRTGGSALAKIQALLDAVGASVPQFLSRYRNLNLVFEGARTTASLPGWLETVKQGFASFRNASDKNAAAGALAQIVSAADSLKTETRLAFQKTPASH